MHTNPLSYQKIIIITAPSGSGKSTIVQYLLETLPQRLAFSVSACTRQPRKGEFHGKNYYFISVEEFEKKIADDAFIEYEMVYQGQYYGTLKEELHRIWQKQQIPLLDIDVHGAKKMKDLFGKDALSLFIQAPSLDILAQRLRQRGTDSEETIQERLQKATHELTFTPYFDHIIVNNQLEEACNHVSSLVQTFIS
jgi:guanylate kinase